MGQNKDCPGTRPLDARKNLVKYEVFYLIASMNFVDLSKILFMPFFVSIDARFKVILIKGE